MSSKRRRSLDPRREAGERIRQEIYAGYPAAFAANVQRAWRERGVPRARYVHNAVGVNATEVIVVQREGTIEEIGQALVDAGAADGVILDNGGRMPIAAASSHRRSITAHRARRRSCSS